LLCGGCGWVWWRGPQVVGLCEVVGWQGDFGTACSSLFLVWVLWGVPVLWGVRCLALMRYRNFVTFGWFVVVVRGSGVRQSQASAASWGRDAGEGGGGRA